MHYGVDETGDYGAYTTELSLHIQNLTLSAWAGFGTGNDYQEWDFTVAYNFQFGLKAIWKINRFISLFGAINYSVAMTALREIDQGNEVWASAGVTFTY